MQYNEDMIRDYLLRRIARKNKRISGVLKDVVKSNRDSYNSGFNEILGFFADGLYGETMRQIFKHIEDNKTKRYAPYNYFDIDTLNAYDVYLQKILSETDSVANSIGHKWSTSSDFHKGFIQAKSSWRDMIRKSSSENGYYNAKNPVGVVKERKNGITVLAPKKPMSDEQFAKKYNERQCADELKAYLDMKHKFKEINKTVEETKQREEYAFDYMGKTLKLEVIDKSYYADIQGRGLISITAEGKEGRLYTTNYNDGRVYNGDLYDLDGNLIEVDGGGQIFYENKNFFDEFMAKQEENYCNKEGEDGQMHLF